MRNLFKPETAVIKKITAQTPDTATYTLAFADERKQAEYSFQPGQFNMITLLGIGEAPISISSPADERSTFDHTIRRVGNLTKALAGLKEGDTVGIRGPYGNGWPVEEMRGKNILLIGGGIGLAPLRPVIMQVARHREDFGFFEILYGARTPADALFSNEYDAWRKIPDTKLWLTVDWVPDGQKWGHDVGLVTALVEDRMESKPLNTVVVTCGPEIMMKFVVKGLLANGFKPGQIYVSLERRMECGVAKCGHCQMGPIYVCKDGPVFNYTEIKDLPEEAL
ncbi:MAG: FAD/NAD(P)-binding protein [Syntrophothermus sp.]